MSADFPTPAEIASNNADYKDPYSVMSARRYGDAHPDFFRPSIPGLPEADAVISSYDELPDVLARLATGGTVR